MICCNQFLITFLDPNWPGVTHVSRVWLGLRINVYAEQQMGGFLIVGDSAYPISPNLLKPYSNKRPAKITRSITSILTSLLLVQ